MAATPQFGDLLAAARRQALHLEMRDSYAVPDEADDYQRWRETGERDVDPESSYWAPWVETVQKATARGVVMRRLRIISEPVSDYIRYEHAGAHVNVLAGEDIRWLPRHATVGLLLPALDGWVFDDNALLHNHFTGDSTWGSPPLELHSDRSLVAGYVAAFETAWERGIPHAHYQIR
ncbi:DUF6879 family protein [Streptomyces termitum]|uniref:DUF6879 family protein n=1 Tax=Streptomyces termitum TaxID=67368 RepID=UPI0033A3C68F